MTNDISQINLKEPAPVDWENYGKVGTYQTPPETRDAKGDFVIFYGTGTPVQDESNEGWLQYLIDPLTIKNGPSDGYIVRFSRVNTRPYQDGKGNPKKGNPNSLADYLRATGISAKPQTNSEYQAAVRLVGNKSFPFVADWEAYNKDTQEKVRGFFNFPADPDRPGHRKAILHAGDILSLTDNKGTPTGEIYTVKSEVLFANLKLKYFRDPSRTK